MHPQSIDGIKVSSALSELSKTNSSNLKFRKKHGGVIEGEYDFVFVEDRKSHLVSSLRVGTSFKDKKTAYYEALDKNFPQKGMFDECTKLFLKTFPDYQNLSDDDLFESFKCCVAVVTVKRNRKHKQEMKQLDSMSGLTTDQKIKLGLYVVGFVVVIALMQIDIEPSDECGSVETNPYYSTCKANRMLEDMGSRYRVPAQ